MVEVNEYETITEAVQAANGLFTRGVANDEVFVLAHDNGVTDEVADSSKAEKIGVGETGVGTAVKNLFQGKGDKLRSKMEEIGLSSVEAEVYEKKLDEGKILLFSKNENNLM
ncbi:general stress protein [Lysinibacillus yapensis]|uniref:General stress protein n=1 Tax=Ureibacillus yapensis TaxID=2304605 RepID=A0A396SEA7_9BACL|nr:general stress protein [Lysinibacillus yapensis]RHW40043.1 general stress protein [Lysinibacillus yapensis]